MKKRIVVVCAILVGGVALWGGWACWHPDHKTPKYRTARIERGEIVQTVRATGSVQPVRLVQVGTQVTGPIRKLYVDYNDSVKEGDVVAQIDPTVYEARLAQDRATLAQAEAQVEQIEARLLQAQGELKRAKELARREMIAAVDVEAATANCDTLQAQLKAARAAVEHAKASLRLSQANLAYTTIRSPVNGVVVARNVSEGQTVVASLSAQVLFLIAADLKDVLIEASVPEAEMGRIQVGQPVLFTVDAYDRPFRGTVTQMRLSAVTVQNVVTYPVIVGAENPDLHLFPGMTANVVFEVARRRDVLKVPNAALRFRPPDEDRKSTGTVAVRGAQSPKPAESNHLAHSGLSKGRRRPSSWGTPLAEAAHGRTQGHRDTTGRSRGTVWVPDGTGHGLRPVEVDLGISDGSFTELLSSLELQEGQEVVIGMTSVASQSRANVVNPFAPPVPPGMRRAAR